MTFALGKLDEAIAIEKSSNISLSDTAIPSGGGSSANLVQFMNRVGARMLVGNLRNGTEKAAANWAKVLTYANAGVKNDYEIYMHDATWYDLIPKTDLVYPGWARTGMRVVNIMDPSQPAYWENGVTEIPESTDPIDERLTTDYGYLGSNNFKPERGQYHYRNYRYSKLDDYITIWTVNITEFSKAENDMYKLETLAAAGNLGGAASVIKVCTRTTRGKLPAVASDANAIKNAIHH
jgi:hypothetical protein